MLAWEPADRCDATRGNFASRSRGRGEDYFFLRVVLRFVFFAVFFAADFVFDLALFAILPS
ncbi:MAG TPA: hypothetical protein VF913_01960 [Xanthobacteraceae bacterium]